MSPASVSLALYVFALVVFGFSKSTTWVEDIAGYVLAGVYVVETIARWRGRFAVPLEYAGIAVLIGMSLVHALLDDGDGDRALLGFILTALMGLIATNIVIKGNGALAIELGLHAGLLWSSIGVIYVGIGAAGSRVFGTLGNANMYGITLVVGVALILSRFAFLFQAGNRQRYRGIEFLGFVIGGLYLFQVFALTGSRQSILAMSWVIALFGYLVVRERRIKQSSVAKISVFIVLAGIVYAGWYWISVSEHWERLSRIGSIVAGDFSGERQRMELLVSAINLWLERPIFGWGFDEFRYQATAGAHYSHNNYAEMLANHGLVGLVAYYSCFALIVLNAKRLRASCTARNYLIAALTGLWLLIDLTKVTYASKILWICLAMLIGVIARARRERSAQVSSRKSGRDYERVDGRWMVRRSNQRPALPRT